MLIQRAQGTSLCVCSSSQETSRCYIPSFQKTGKFHGQIEPKRASSCLALPGLSEGMPKATAIRNTRSLTMCQWDGSHPVLSLTQPMVSVPLRCTQALWGSLVSPNPQTDSCTPILTS